MTAQERKPFRIACRRWKNCCNRLQIQKIEKFHVPGVSQFEDIEKILLTSERSIINLKISNHRLESFNSDLWSQVEQLELENCIVTKDFMEKILTCCEKLQHLTLGNVNILYLICDTTFDKTDRFGKFFKLNELKIVATSVKTLVINYRKKLTLNEISSLISVFPNVVKLEIRFQHSSQPLVRRARVGHAATDICERLVNHIATKLLQLEHLIMKCPQKACQCEKFIQEVIFWRLKTFEYYNRNELAHRPSRTENYFTRVYCSNVTANLHSQHLTSIEFFGDTKAKVIIDVLKNLTSLLEVNVKLKSMRDFFEFSEFYKALANSKLISIKIRNKLKPDWIGFLPQMLDDRSLPVNSTVRKMTITNYHEEDIFISIFLKCFSALNTLNVTLFDKTSNFTNIFNQANLKCVELKSKQVWSLGHDQSTSLSSKSLTTDIFVENLEYLHIDIGILKELLVRQPSTFFSNLRFLHISSLGYQHMFSEQLPLTQEDLRCLPLHSLEGVCMRVHGCISNIFTLFSKPSNFPRIKYIEIKLHNEHLIRHCQLWLQSWFKYCPCLKSVILSVIRKNTGICLCYDPIKGEIREFDPAQGENSHPRANLNSKLMFRYFERKTLWNSWINSI